jgi:sugar O-acyltransferase (sialic acid O-acetyltransferase NeuD family)
MVVADLVKMLTGNLMSFFSDSSQVIPLKGNVPTMAYQPSAYAEAGLVIAIGNNQVREKLAQKISHNFVTLIHPAASIAPDITLGKGTVVLANATIQVNASIGDHVIINAGAVVDHDAIVEDFVHIAPNAYIGGGAVIKKGAVVGAGAVVMRNTVVEPGIEILPLTMVG